MLTEDDVNRQSSESGRELIIRFLDAERVLLPGDQLTIGRMADLTIDANNRSLHRELIRVWSESSQWWLSNLGSSITIVATDLDGASFARIVPGGQMPVPFTKTVITFSAGRANYRLTFRQSSAPGHVGRTKAVAWREAHIDRTLTSSTIVFNDDQRELLTLLASLRSGGPLSVNDLPSNRQLARELGWTLSKLNRKLDNLCLKLQRAGFSGLVGDTADTARDRRVRLAEIALEQRLIDIDRSGIDLE